MLPYIDPALFQSSSKRTWDGKPDSDPSTWRRSVYVFSKRSIPLPMFEVFDKPDSVGSCARRNRSTIAPQALILMNNAFVLMEAKMFAERLTQGGGRRSGRAGGLAFQLALGRKPTSTEREQSVQFLRAGTRSSAGLLPSHDQPERVRIYPMSTRFLSRRQMLQATGGGIASLAFSHCYRQQTSIPRRRSHRGRRTSRQGESGHLDFLLRRCQPRRHVRSKAAAAERQGEALTGKGEVVVSQGHPGGLMPSLWKFKKYGQSGMDVSELFPHVAKKVDDIALIRSMYSISNDHGPALFQMNTGFIQAGYPSMGSWVTYGLGTENQSLPAFVVFSDWRGGPIGGAPNWGNGFMPAAYQGTPFRSTGDPIVDLKPPKDITPERQRRWLDLLRKLNEQHLAKNPEDTELSARIQSYELAFRMQSHAVDAVDVNKESAATRALYGVDEKATEYVGRQCLMARRLG